MPAVIPLAAAAIGVGASAAAGASGVGRNDSRQGTFDQKSAYDPNKFEWGGKPGLADADANYFRGGAEWAQGRQGVGVNYGQANEDRASSAGARLAQAQMADRMSYRAQGLTPSISGMQAQQDQRLLQQQGLRDRQGVAASQASAGASARGAAGLAMAGQNAANNTATAQSAINQNMTQGIQNISGQAQVNMANERLAAEQAAAAVYGGMRGQDLASQQQTAQQAQYQAGLSAQQRGLNDQYALAMHNNEMNVRQNQLNAGMNQQGMLANSSTATNQMNAAANQANANRSMQLFQGGLGAVQGAMSSMGGGGK